MPGEFGVHPEAPAEGGGPALLLNEEATVKPKMTDLKKKGNDFHVSITKDISGVLMSFCDYKFRVKAFKSRRQSKIQSVLSG